MGWGEERDSRGWTGGGGGWVMERQEGSGKRELLRTHFSL